MPRPRRRSRRQGQGFGLCALTTAEQEPRARARDACWSKPGVPDFAGQRRFDLRLGCEARIRGNRQAGEDKLRFAKPDDLFVAVGQGHDVNFWAAFLQALERVDPGMWVNIEHEDVSFGPLEGLRVAAETLKAANSVVAGW